MTDEDAELEVRLAALEREVATLREEVATMTDCDISLLKGTVCALTDADIDTIHDLTDAGQAVNTRLAQHDDRLEAVESRLADLGTVGQDQTSKAEKFAAILTFAQNKRNGKAKVSLTANEIRGCVSVSCRYAYDLIEAMADEVDGVSVREPEQVQTGSGVEQKRKALLVDCDQVHTHTGGVNQFTTRRAIKDPD